MRIRPALRITRWEVTAGAGGIDRRTVVLLLASLLALGALAPAVAGLATPPDAGLYRVGIDGDSPYHEPVARDPTLAVAPASAEHFAEGRLDVLVANGRIRVHDTAKGRAAGAAFTGAVERYNDRLMRTEPDQVAAFPVTVQVEYVERGLGPIADRAGDSSGGSDGGSGGGADGSGSGGSETGDGGATSTSGDRAAGSGDGVPSLGGAGTLFGETAGTPSDITPPFPFVSLVLAFAFVVPMNFVIQAYASSVLHERTNRRGELLLIAPVSRWTIIAGKTLPYFAAMVAIATLTAAAIGGGPVSVLAVVPVALLFLACGFVGALLARSHKELTFVLVTVSVAVTSYVFVPAIFTQIHPIAAISPLTLVVRDLEGAALSPGTVAFSTIPVVVAAAVLFGLGGGLYREEDLFAQRPVPAKLLDALATPISGRLSAPLMSMLSIPFVFLAELLAVAVLFVLPLRISLPILLVILAGIEELAKSLHVYAGFERGRYDRSLRAAAVVGALSGAGFFLGEKAAAAAQLVGLSSLDLGRAAFEIGAGIGGGSGPVLVALLLGPLVLHAATAALTASGASRGRSPYVASVVLAVVVHAGYNLGVVTRLG